MIWLGTSMLQAWQGKSRPPRESLVVTVDGTPLIESMPLDNLSQVTYRDLNGRPHEDVERKDQLSAIYLSSPPRERSWLFSQLDWQQRIRVFMDEREPAAIWYFIHDGLADGAGYFVGYERVSNRLIGYIGLSGLRADPVPPGDRIPVLGAQVLTFSSWSSAPFWVNSGRMWVSRPNPWDVPPRLVHVPSANRLRVVDLSARTVTTVFEAPEPINSVGVPYLASYSGTESKKEQPIIIRAGRKLYKLDHGYRLNSTFTLPPELNPTSTITWYDTGDGPAVAECAVVRKAGESLDQEVARTKVYRIGADGSILESIEVSLESGTNAPSDRAQLALAALALPSPAMLLAGDSLLEKEALLAVEGSSTQSYSEALVAILKRAWPSLLAVLAGSLVLASIAWRRVRVFELSQREQAVWAAFVLLFGLPAFVGFLLHRRWPVREPCPNCHARSARGRDACAECGRLFPDPEPKGIEIFA
jgi:hypothetical protein